MADMAEKCRQGFREHPEPGPTGKGHGDTPSPDTASKAGAVAISPDDTIIITMNTDATGKESASSHPYYAPERRYHGGNGNQRIAASKSPLPSSHVTMTSHFACNKGLPTSHVAMGT